MADKDSEKLKGTAKEMAGKVTGSDQMAKEGQSQQEKADAEEKAQREQNKQERHSGE